nr:hypothetical protein [Pseudomonadota bacterium]
MTSAPASARRGLPGSLLARGAQRTGWGFVAIIVLSVVASLILIGAVAARQAAEAWRGRLTGSATVVVRAGGLE